MAFVVYEFSISIVVSTIVSSLISALNTTRAFWEDMAINRMILKFGRSLSLMIVCLFVLAVNSITNLILLTFSFLFYNFWGFKEIILTVIWTLSSSLMATILSVMGEIAKVNLTFFSGLLMIPLLVGFYGALTSEDVFTFGGLMVVMGVFYFAFIVLFSDVIL